MAIGDEPDDLRDVAAQIALLETAVAERDAELAKRDSKLAEQAAKLGEQDAKIAALTEQMAKLAELLGRNSKNSHLPPSSDGPGSAGGAASGRRSKAGRKRGGQKGHRGQHRELLSPAQVQTFVDLFPAVCLGCAHEVAAVVDVAACRYQQLELRDHRPHVTEWRRHEVECARCGTSTRAAYDRGQIPSSAFGPCLTAVVAMLTGAYHLSRRKTRRLLLELFGIAVSLGAISAMERRASEALASAHDEALREVQHAGIKHTDATTWTRAGVLMSLWTLASAAATAYQIFTDGARATIQPLFGPRRGILVSDRATVFGFWAMELRQICHAHLLRKFVAFSERDGPGGAIGRELLELTSLMFEYWHGFKDGQLTRPELQHWLRPVQRDIERLVERGANADIARLSGSCADILAHRDALWTFVTHDGVEPTNNHAELELRDFVLWRKRSFGSQSERGERFAERVMTAVRTARKQGKDVFDFMVRSVTAHVFGTPPPQLIAPRLSA
ncbi:MAG: IS66 family transposase [Kofleriaceae bacterium]